VHPKVAGILVGNQGVPGPILEIEKETGRHFHFEGTEALPIDHFEVVLEGSREEVEERALPFREGEEVLVLIEEPHMYNEDDAVAKLDGYVISVTGAASLVGERTLVLIEKVGRSAAQASLVNPPEGAGPSDGDGDGSSASGPRRRRRGRRGGRNRRRPAESASS
jgi:ribonuclease G